MKDYSGIQRAKYARAADMSRDTPREDARRAFERPAYQVGSLIREQGEQIERMTVEELVQYLLDEVGAQRLHPSDPVPDDLEMRIRRKHRSVAEYYADKYGIGGDTSGTDDKREIDGAQE